MANEPIDAQDYISGVNVVDIGDLRVMRGKTRRPHSACNHTALSYDSAERRIWCRDCETDVDAFDAFVSLVERFSAAKKRIDDDRAEVEAARAHSLRLIAAKEIEKAWRSKTMLPACPSCKSGLWPKDFVLGQFSLVGKTFAEMRKHKPPAE